MWFIVTIIVTWISLIIVIIVIILCIVLKCFKHIKTIDSKAEMSANIIQNKLK